MKNPAAVALGKLGGKARGRKGFAAIDPQRFAEIQKKGTEAAAAARKAKAAKKPKAIRAEPAPRKRAAPKR